jgi:hypothetical protein
VVVVAVRRSWSVVSHRSSVMVVATKNCKKKLPQKIDGMTMMVLLVHSEQHLQIFTVEESSNGYLLHDRLEWMQEGGV